MLISILLYGGAYLGLNFVAALILGLGGVIYSLINPNIQNFIMSNYLHGIMFLSIVLSTLLYLLIFRAKKRSFVSYMRFRKISKKDIISIVILALASFIFISVGFMMIESNLPKASEKLKEYSELMEPLMNGNMFFIILVVGIVGPIFEEILFRGIIFNRLNRNMNIVVSLILQAIIFGAFHMNLIQGIYTFILGIIIGLTYILLNSIWAPIIVHVVFNSLNFVLGPLLTLAQNNSVLSIALMISSFIAIIVLLMVLKNNFNMKKELSIELCEEAIG